MIVLLLALGSLLLYLIAYHTYGRWLGRKIFELSAARLCPSHELADGKDFLSTPRGVVFGHHFTSIAGTGPIVGPAIGVMWGWMPALLWVVFGSIFVGAVHDLGSLVVSLRNQGKSVGDLAGILVGPRVRVLFMIMLVLGLTLVLAVFGLVVATVFKQFPAAIFPCFFQIPLALAIGFWLRRHQAKGLLCACGVALVLMYFSVLWGDWGLLRYLNETLAAMPIWAWTVVLLMYCYVASVLPVWALLQPRDFINSLQLLSVLGLLVLGVIVAALCGGAPVQGEEFRPALRIVAPAFHSNPEGAPSIFPFLFITIACGAVSGFHCLVSSGTSSKQLANERDAQFVGYGAMLVEGFMAVLVILACVAGLGLGLRLADGTVLRGVDAWTHQYANWREAGTLASTIGAFVSGSGNFLAALGLPSTVSVSLMGVFIASFAGTTMDSACRLQRYLIQELASTLPQNSGRRAPALLSWARNSYGATLLAVLSAGLLAASPPAGAEWSWANAGKGGTTLWPIFGATNQLLAGIAFIVMTFYVRSFGKPIWFLIPPMLFMLVMPAWAMSAQLFVGTETSPSWLSAGNWPLVLLGSAMLALEVWLVLEAFFIWRRSRP